MCDSGLDVKTVKYAANKKPKACPAPMQKVLSTSYSALYSFIHSFSDTHIPSCPFLPFSPFHFLFSLAVFSSTSVALFSAPLSSSDDCHSFPFTSLHFRFNLHTTHLYSNPSSIHAHFPFPFFSSPFFYLLSSSSFLLSSSLFSFVLSLLPSNPTPRSRPLSTDNIHQTSKTAPSPSSVCSFSSLYLILVSSYPSFHMTPHGVR